VNYKSIMKEISLSIKNSNSHKEIVFITKESKKNLIQYRKNILFHILNQVSYVYPTIVYLIGEKNLFYLSRLFYNEHNNNHSNIYNFISYFPLFLESKYEIHKDDILAEISKIDLLLHQSSSQSIKSYEGILEYWKDLQKKKKSKVTINFNQEVELSLDIKGDECYILQQYV